MFTREQVSEIDRLTRAWLADISNLLEGTSKDDISRELRKASESKADIGNGVCKILFLTAMHMSETSAEDILSTIS